MKDSTLNFATIQPLIQPITKLTMIQTTASLRVPMGYIYVILPVSGILIMIFAAMNAAEMFHHEFKEAGEVRV